MITIPQAVLVLQNANVMPKVTSMKAVIPINIAPRTGLTFENRNDFNTKHIIGLVLRVNEDNTGTKTAKDGGRLITREWAENAFLEIKKGTETLYDQIPLSSLIPPVGENYVKVWIEDFDPSVSKFTFSTLAADTGRDRVIEIQFIHSEL